MLLFIFPSFYKLATNGRDTCFKSKQHKCIAIFVIVGTIIGNIIFIFGTNRKMKRRMNKKSQNVGLLEMNVRVII